MSAVRDLPNAERCRRLISESVRKLGLRLDGLTVLTEAANGYFALTPLIAAYAGADHVYALTRDSRYGKATDVGEHVRRLAMSWGVSGRIEVLFDREDERVGNAVVVTNVGFVRPLEASFLRRLKFGAVIPLMFETWEFRPQDLDLAACRRLEIPVLGTDESHVDLQIFSYVGRLALKLLFQLDIEVFRSRIVVVGSGRFGKVTHDALLSAGAHVNLVDPSGRHRLNDPQIQEPMRLADGLVIVEHHEKRTLIGPGGELTAHELHALNPSLVVAHVCGGVDRMALEEAGLACCPNRFAPPGFMSVTTDFLGPRPLVDLHTAGLKVGETMARIRSTCRNGFETEMKTLQCCPLAQGFAGRHHEGSALDDGATVVARCGT